MQENEYRFFVVVDIYEGRKLKRRLFCNIDRQIRPDHKLMSTPEPMTLQEAKDAIEAMEKYVTYGAELRIVDIGNYYFDKL